MCKNIFNKQYKFNKGVGTANITHIGKYNMSVPISIQLFNKPVVLKNHEVLKFNATINIGVNKILVGCFKRKL